MGNRIPNEQSSIEFYSQTVDRNIGFCQIYTAKHLPMCFVMKLRTHQHQLLQPMTRIQNSQNRNLISLYGFVRVATCDCDLLTIGNATITYWEYFNYYLEDLVKVRRDRFEDTELWYFVKVCVIGYLGLSKEGVMYCFGRTSLVVTPEGKLKLFWAAVRDYNMHLPFMRADFENGRVTEPAYYSPEQLLALKDKNRSLDLQKCNVFSFGMLLFYVLTLTDPIVYYGDFTSQVNLQAINKTIPKEYTGFAQWLLEKGAKSTANFFTNCGNLGRIIFRFSEYQDWMGIYQTGFRQYFDKFIQDKGKSQNIAQKTSFLKVLKKDNTIIFLTLYLSILIPNVSTEYSSYGSLPKLINANNRSHGAHSSDLPN